MSIKLGLQGAVWQSLAKVVSVGLGLWTTRMMLASLSQEAIGIFYLLMAVFLVLDGVADGGTRFVGVANWAENKNKAKWLATIFWARLILVGIGFAFGWWWTGTYAPLLPYRNEARIALSMIFFTSGAGLLELWCQVQLKIWWKSIIEVLFSLLVALSLFFFGVRNLGFVYIIFLVSRIVSLVFGWALVNRDLSLSVGWWKPDWAEIKKLWKIAWPMGLYLLIFTSYDRAIDSLLLNHFWNSSAVASYGLAYKVYGNLVLPVYFFMNTVFAKMASLKGQELWSQMKKYLVVLVLMSLGIILGVWLVSPTILPWIWPNVPTDSVAILKILSLALVFSAINHVFGFGLVGKGGQRKLLLLGVVSLSVNFILNWLFIPHFGYWAAAWITILTELVMSLGLLAIWLH